MRSPFKREWKTVTKDEALNFVLSGATTLNALRHKSRRIRGITAQALMYDYYRNVKGYSDDDRVLVTHERVGDLLYG